MSGSLERTYWCRSCSCWWSAPSPAWPPAWPWWSWWRGPRVCPTPGTRPASHCVGTGEGWRSFSSLNWLFLFFFRWSRRQGGVSVNTCRLLQRVVIKSIISVISLYIYFKIITFGVTEGTNLEKRIKWMDIQCLDPTHHTCLEIMTYFWKYSLHFWTKNWIISSDHFSDEWKMTPPNEWTIRLIFF